MTPRTADPDKYAGPLLEALRTLGSSSTSILAAHAKCSGPTAQKYLEQLAAKGAVHVTGVSNQRRWHLGAATKGTKRAPNTEGDTTR